MSSTISWLLVLTAFCSVSSAALALPAFALREKAACSVCHVNGSAPQLTRYGFSYRRAGYRNPAKVGDAASDKAAMTLTEHMAVGLNFDYGYATTKARGREKPKETANQFFIRALEFWPLVGSFQGNVGVFSKIEATPATVSPGSDVAPSGGGTNLTRSELVLAKGQSDLFVTLRGGLIAGQGFGAGDQWLDHDNLPLIDTLSARLDQDTLVTPLGANRLAQLGTEFGVAWRGQTFATIGAYNGFDGTTGRSGTNQATRTPVMNNGYANGAKDFKAQVDQFIGWGTEVTLAHYRGAVSLLDPTTLGIWRSHFDTSRLYLTQAATAGLTFLAGASAGTFEFKDEDHAEEPGKFRSGGGFAGATTSWENQLTISGRLDYFEYSRYQAEVDRVDGAALMAGVPFDTTLVTVHYTVKRSDLDGLTRDVRAEWRVIFQLI